MRIVLGVSGGIAAYKAVLVLRLLAEAGHDVTVVPTAGALRFVGTATWEALSGRPVTSDIFDGVDQVRHVAVGRSADLLLVVPATADLLARAANGRADDLLTGTLLTASCPVVMAPAMHTEMWRHPATVANVATLRERGVHVIEPAVGRLTGADSGEGRLPDPADIVAAALAVVTPQDLAGRTVVVSAGGTQEPIDPVRFLGNRSSGRQGYAVAAAAAARGAAVTLVSANVTLPVPAGVAVVRVRTALELRDAVLTAAAGADAVVMAAAVADFRPAEALPSKVKKSGGPAPTLTLVENPDILRELVATRAELGVGVLVGFAAETGDATASVIEHGRAKARSKRADLLVVNQVSDTLGFGTTTNSVTILDASGDEVAQAAGTKAEVAHAVLTQIAALLPRSTTLGA